METSEEGHKLFLSEVKGAEGQGGLIGGSWVCGFLQQLFAQL